MSSSRGRYSKDQILERTWQEVAVVAAADQSGDPEKTVSHQTPQAHVPTNSPVSSPTLRCRRRSWLRAPYPVCPTDNQILTPRRAPGHASRIAPLPPATLLLVPCWRVRVSITETSDWVSGIAPVEIPLRRQTCRMFHCRGYLAIVPGCPETPGDLPTSNCPRQNACIGGFIPLAKRKALTASTVVW